MDKKLRLPNIKQLERGSGKLYDKLNKLGVEWRDTSTTLKRKQEIERIYNTCLKDWDRLKENMRKRGVHIGNL